MTGLEEEDLLPREGEAPSRSKEATNDWRELAERFPDLDFVEPEEGVIEIVFLQRPRPATSKHEGAYPEPDR